MTVELREAQNLPDRGPAPVVILTGDPTPGKKRGEVVLTRGEAVRLHADLAELVDRWR